MHLSTHNHKMFLLLMQLPLLMRLLLLMCPKSPLKNEKGNVEVPWRLQKRAAQFPDDMITQGR